MEVAAQRRVRPTSQLVASEKKQNLSGDNSIVVPPDPIPNSEVKHNRADGSVWFPHVRVGHRQTPNLAEATQAGGLFALWH